MKDCAHLVNRLFLNQVHHRDEKSQSKKNLSNFPLFRQQAFVQTLNAR